LAEAKCQCWVIVNTVMNTQTRNTLIS
jgi:hypothetical protein